MSSRDETDKCDDSNATLDALIARFIVAVDAGQEVDREQFIHEHPRHAESLRAFFADFDCVCSAVQEFPPPSFAARVTPSNLHGDVYGLQLSPETSLRWKQLIEKLRTVQMNGEANRFVGLDWKSSVIEDKYEIVDLIGHGGMGQVWLAKQLRPVEREVAIKLILVGSDNPAVVSRFEAERQVLALMDHPGIAKVYDGGTTDVGQPYFVMEYIRGTPIHEFCDTNRLDIIDRLRVFIQVCEAIQHAHQKGIIHRDLKPSNILVAKQDDQFTPKIIDFGLAKALEQRTRLTNSTLLTGIGQVVGTLRYMSPEQADIDSQDIDVRSDVYSLGVVLYELLTGSTPLSEACVAGQTIIKILGTIRESDPPRPSQRLGSTSDGLQSICEQRRSDPRRLTQVLKGDLDWILVKALERNLQRRYGSVAEFADDLSNYLNGLPIRARPPSTTYVLNKFIQRHRLLVTSATAVVMALAIGLGTSIYFGVAESRARREAEVRGLRLERTIVLLESLFEDIDPVTDVASDQALRERLSNSLSNLASDLQAAILAGENSNEIDIRILVKMTMAMRGLGLDVSEELQAVRALLDEKDEKQLELALSIDTLTAGDRGIDSMRQTAQRFAEVYGADDARTLGVEASVAYMLSQSNRSEEAVRLYETLLDSVSLAVDEPALYERLLHDASYAFRELKQIDKSVQLLEQAVQRLSERLGPDHLNTLQAVTTLGTRLRELDSRHTESRATLENACALLSKQHGRWHRRTCLALMELMVTCAIFDQEGDNLDRLAELLPEMEQSYQFMRQTLGEFHEEAEVMFSNLAVAYGIAGDLDRYLAMHVDRYERCRISLGDEDEATLATAWRLVVAYEQLEELPQAIDLANQYLAIANKLFDASDERVQRARSKLLLWQQQTNTRQVEEQ